MKKLRLKEMKAPARQSPGAKGRGQNVTAASSAAESTALRRRAAKRPLNQLSVGSKGREGREDAKSGQRYQVSLSKPFLEKCKSDSI